MKKAIIAMVIVFILSTCDIAHGAVSDKELATEWANSHGGGYTITKVITKAQGGKKGKVKGTNYIVKYPKKVKKGKRVTCYMVEQNGDVYAMVCLGIVKE